MTWRGNVRASRQDGGVQLASTATQRTYRYVRLSILGTVLLLTVSLVAVSIDVGPIASISAVYYTPGRTVFVGALFAVALALVALSGRSIEQALLDIGALCAPLIAIVPTPIRTGDVPGYVVNCPDPTTPCVPAAELAGIDNGMISVVVLAVCGVAAAAILARVQRTTSPGLTVAIGVTAALVVVVTVWWLVAPAGFVEYGHWAATSTFFGIIAIVAAIGAITSSAPWRVWYALIAIGITVDLVFVVTVVALRFNGVDLMVATGAPLIFVGEALAVALFAAFWLLQTVQLWNDPDPSLSAAPPASRSSTR